MNYRWLALRRLFRTRSDELSERSRREVSNERRAMPRRPRAIPKWSWSNHARPTRSLDDPRMTFSRVRDNVLMADSAARRVSSFCPVKSEQEDRNPRSGRPSCSIIRPFPPFPSEKTNDWISDIVNHGTKTTRRDAEHRIVPREFTVSRCRGQ